MRILQKGDFVFRIKDNPKWRNWCYHCELENKDPKGVFEVQSLSTPLGLSIKLVDLQPFWDPKNFYFSHALGETGKTLEDYL